MVNLIQWNASNIFSLEYSTTQYNINEFETIILNIKNNIIKQIFYFLLMIITKFRYNEKIIKYNEIK